MTTSQKLSPLKLIANMGSAVFLSLAMAAVAYTSTASARTLTIHNDDKGNNIRIYHEESHQNAVFEVNGKTFYWRDLTPEQQQRITKIEAKIDSAEKHLDINEEKIEALAEKLENKAQKIEAEVEKMELASIKIDKTHVNMRDVEKMMEKLEKVAQLNEEVVRFNEAEIHELEKKIEVIENSFSKEIELHVGELENELLAIATEIN